MKDGQKTRTRTRQEEEEEGREGGGGEGEGTKEIRPDDIQNSHYLYACGEIPSC